MNRWRRLAANALGAWWATERYFPESSFERIAARIAESETGHRGNIVFAIEARIGLKSVARGCTPRQRAEEVFAQLEVWNTSENAGILVYALLAERAIEIVADRGIARVVPDPQWSQICLATAAAFARGEFLAGALTAVDALSGLLRQALPALPDIPRENDLIDRPVLL